MTVWNISGVTCFFWQARLRDEMPGVDGTANPMLWWGELTDADGDRITIACGVKTQKEAVEAVKREIGYAIAPTNDDRDAGHIQVSTKTTEV